MSHNPGMLSGLIGPTQQAANPQQLQNAYNSPLSQAQAAQQAQQMFNQLARRQQHNWVIDGETMTMDEFANTLWPDTCPEKTFFYLKYSKEQQ